MCKSPPLAGIDSILRLGTLAIFLLIGNSQIFWKASNNTVDQETTKWKVFTESNRDFGYSVEYPSDWSVEQNENVCFFRPPHSKSNKESIAIVVINYRKTPPLPVHHTYTTIRTLTVNAAEIPVRKRQPSPSTERYFAQHRKDDYVAEFRFFLDRQHDAVFDRMVSTFTFTFTK